MSNLQKWGIVLGATCVAGELGTRGGAVGRVGQVAGIGVVIYAAYQLGVWGVVGAVLAGSAYVTARGGFKRTTEGSAPSPLGAHT